MEPTDVAYCPHCCNTAPQDLCGHFVYTPSEEPNEAYVLTRCLSCYGALLYHYSGAFMPGFSHGRFHLADYELLWPKPAELHLSVPKAVARIYAEAALIRARAPNAFANQIRRCLEAVCKDRGATANTLAQKLEQLAARGEIPQTLVEMTDVLRHLGNMGSHADDEDVDPSYVGVIDEFFRAIIEYVYIAPFKVAEFKKRLAAAQDRV